MVYAIIFGCLGFLYVGVAIVGRVIERRLKRRRVELATETSRYWWKHRKAERDMLLATAADLVQRGRFRRRRPGEDLWTYAKAFDDWASAQLKMAPVVAWNKPITSVQVTGMTLPKLPKLPSFRDLLPKTPELFVHGKSSHSVEMTIRTYWWSTEREGVVHQVVALQHDDQRSYVPRCDLDAYMDGRSVKEHLDGEGPLITCVQCFLLRKT